MTRTRRACRVCSAVKQLFLHWLAQTIIEGIEMRLVPILAAILVSALIYVFIFQRDALTVLRRGVLGAGEQREEEVEHGD